MENVEIMRIWTNLCEAKDAWVVNITIDNDNANNEDNYEPIKSIVSLSHVVFDYIQ